MADKKNKGQKDLIEKVKDNHLCTGCGACVNLCPYQRCYEDNLIALFDCNIDEGRCYSFCPRTPIDLEAMRKRFFDRNDLTPEIGAIKGLYITRAKDERIRAHAQHGGTVTALMALALDEGLIDSAVMAAQGDSLLPYGVTESDSKKILQHGKSSFVVSPNVAEFNRISKNETQQKIGVVATPCQALAYAKMRMKPNPENTNNIEKLKLVVGLFCGWALSWTQLIELFERYGCVDAITGMDIPPSKYQMMQVHSNNTIVEIPLADVEKCVRESCHYCYDMTAEFGDVSIGSARLTEGWEVAKGWNQVIVRTKLGNDLLDLARKKGVLEFRDVPEGNLDRLKKASLNKKLTAIENLTQKTQNTRELIYIDGNDPVFCALLNREKV